MMTLYLPHFFLFKKNRKKENQPNFGTHPPREESFVAAFLHKKLQTHAPQFPLHCDP